MGRPYTTRAVLQNAVSATGNGSTLDVSGLASVGFQVAGTFTATVSFEATIDGVNWFALRVRNVATGVRATSATAAGGYVADCAGLMQVRAPVTWTSGTSVTVTAYAGPESPGEGDSTSAPAVPSAALSTRVAINAASSGDNTLVSGTGGQTIRVHKVFLVCTSAVNIKFKDGASTDFHPALPMQAGGGLVLDFDGDPWFVTTDGNALILNLSGAVQVSGRIYYTKS